MLLSLFVLKHVVKSKELYSDSSKIYKMLFQIFEIEWPFFDGIRFEHTVLCIVK